MNNRLVNGSLFVFILCFFYSGIASELPFSQESNALVWAAVDRLPNSNDWDDVRKNIMLPNATSIPYNIYPGAQVYYFIDMKSRLDSPNRILFLSDESVDRIIKWYKGAGLLDCETSPSKPGVFELRDNCDKIYIPAPVTIKVVTENRMNQYGNFKSLIEIAYFN